MWPGVDRSGHLAVRGERPPSRRRRAARTCAQSPQGRRTTTSATAARRPLRERRFAELHASGEFVHDGGTSWNAILQLDHRRKGVLLALHELKRLLDRRVALSPRHVRTVLDLAVLQMNVRDAVVVLADEPGRRVPVAGGEVTE